MTNDELTKPRQYRGYQWTELAAYIPLAIAIIIVIAFTALTQPH